MHLQVTLLLGSDIVHVDVMGTHIVILNSLKAGHELLDKRSSIYSDRCDLDRRYWAVHLCYPLILHIF